MTKWTALIVLLVTGLLSGCLFDPGKDSAANEVKDTIVAMPGVTRAGFSTSDAGWSTVTLPYLFVTMATATPQQIRAVVDVLKRNAHEDLETVDITISEKPMISANGTVSDIEADQFIADVERLRQLVPAVGSAGVIKWTRDDVPEGNLYVSAESPVTAILTAIRKSLGNIGLADIWLGESSRVQNWKVYFPLSPDQELQVDSQLESLPVQALAVTVSSGAITELTVAVSDLRTAESQLNGVITALGADPDSPLLLTWQFRKTRVAAAAGTVHVGACGYPTIRGPFQSPEEKALQQRLREQFDTCPR